MNATISGDGARIAYTRNSDATGGSAGTGFVIETAGGVPRRVCDGCEMHGFLADHQSVLAALNDGHAIRLIDVRTGNARDLVVAAAGERLDRPHASPDGRWLAFRRQSNSVGKSFVVRLSPDHPISAEGLRPIDEPTTTGRPCGWSLDSRIVYLLLDTDSFRCLWAQRIDPAGAPVGNPIIVRHFHSTIRHQYQFRRCHHGRRIPVRGSRGVGQCLETDARAPTLGLRAPQVRAR